MDGNLYTDDYKYFITYGNYPQERKGYLKQEYLGKRLKTDYVGEGWIGVDLDGTLAYYDHWRGPSHIGDPIPIMVDKVKYWLENGQKVKIFTARVSGANGFQADIARKAIVDWCVEHIGQRLDVTSEKDFGMIELWDDKCIQVEKNTGRRIR